MKQFASICVLLVLFIACKKEDTIPSSTPLPVSFKAIVSGSEKTFTDQLICKSERVVEGGNHLLSILGSHKINADSFTQVRFTVLDFTRDGITEEKNFALNTNFTGHFVEWKDQVNSTHGKYHFFQSGQLKITKIGADYVSGQFQFTYFTFDHLGNKTGEYTVTDGEFKNLKINRLN